MVRMGTILIQHSILSICSVRGRDQSCVVRPAVADAQTSTAHQRGTIVQLACRVHGVVLLHSLVPLVL